MKLQKPLIVLDLETTGTWIEKDKIIEIAMIRCEPDGMRSVYDQRVNPGIPIPPIVTELTGISDSDVREAPSFREIAPAVLDFIGDEADLAGFNAERFDLPLLEREMHEAGLRLQWQKHRIYDAQKVYHLKEKRDLSAAYRFYCEKTLENAHSALADVEATLEILSEQAVRYGKGDGSIEDLSEFHYKTLSEFYDSDRKLRWWNGELYLMFGKYNKRLSLKQIVQRDPDYLHWILNKDFSDDVKSVVAEALEGKFPEYGKE